VDRDGDGGAGEEDRAYGQGGYAHHVAAQARDGDRPGAVHQQRRQEDHQHQVGIDGDRRHARQEGQGDAASQQGHGRR
jgi:hypothetical protein